MTWRPFFGPRGRAEAAPLASSTPPDDVARAAAPTPPTDIVNHLHALAFQEKLEIRQSVSKMVFWAAGLAVAAVGWMVTNADKVSANRGIMLVVDALFFGSLFALLTRQRVYFDGVARVIRTCDDFYGVFIDGRFVPGTTLYPSEWMAFSTKAWREPIFDVSAAILVLSASVTLGAIYVVEAPAEPPVAPAKARIAIDRRKPPAAPAAIAAPKH